MANNNFTKKPFNCVLCNQGFTTKNVCVRHFEKAHKDVPHDQIQNMIMEISIESINEQQRLNGRFSNGLNASTLAAFSSTTGSSSSNGDSSELDQPLNLANGFYNGNLASKLSHLTNNDMYIDEDDEFDEEDNQNALDLSVKSNDRQSIDQLSSMSRSLDLGGSNAFGNNPLNEPSAEMIRNAISTLLALQSVMPKSLENQQLVAQAHSLLNSNQTMNSNNMNNLLASQQLQTNTNSTSGSLLNLFNSIQFNM